MTIGETCMLSAAEGSYCFEGVADFCGESRIPSRDSRSSSCKPALALLCGGLCFQSPGARAVDFSVEQVRACANLRFSR